MGIRPLIPINFRNAAAQCPSFLSGNQISSPSSSFFSSLSYFSHFFPLFLSTHLHFSVFYFYSNPNYLKVLSSLCLSGSSEKCVSFYKHRGLLWSYSQIYWSRAGKLSLCTLLLCSFAEESALSFPPPKLFFPGERNRSSGLPQITAVT